MQDYVSLDAGHMGFLISALDGDPESVQTPNLSPLPASVKPETVLQAVEFLHRTRVPIQARKRWPDGGSPGDWMRGSIRKEHQAEDGFALCYWRDAGWGNLVYSGKYTDNRFSEELVSASLQLIQEWQPQPAPAWVTCIPSRRHPDLVPDFARRLATALGLPFQACLVKTYDRPEQKGMANSAPTGA